MSIINLKCYRLIPVRPEDWNLLGICWKNSTIYTCIYLSVFVLPLSFSISFQQPPNGLFSTNIMSLSPPLLVQLLYSWVSCLDECSNNLMTMLSLCEHINAPVNY